MRIRTFLFVGFGTILGMTTLLAAQGVYQLSGIERGARSLADGAVRLHADAELFRKQTSTAAGQASDVSKNIKTEILAPVRDNLGELAVLERSTARLAAATAAMTKKLEEFYASGELNAGTKAALQGLIFDIDEQSEKARKETLPYVRSVVAKTKVVGEQAAQARNYLESFTATMGELSSRADTFAKGVAETSESATDAASRATVASRMTLVTAAPVVVLGLVLPFVVGRKVLGTIRTLGNRFNEIATGDSDLRFRLNDKTKDELADVARGFNAFLSRIHDDFCRVAFVAESVAAAATEIAASAEETSRSMVSQGTEIDQVTTSIQTLSDSLDQVTARCTSATEQATRSGELARQGGETVRQTVEGVRSVAVAVKAGADIVADLGQRTEQIGAIVGTINDIADQTNLLALNAAIEAARAGEHGRGFSVVAEEVRKLADRTTKATAEIGSSIQSITERTRAAVEEIERGRGSVDTGVGHAVSAGERLTEIVEGSSGVAQSIAMVAAAATQQNQAATVIATSATNVKTSSREAIEAAKQAAEACTVLSSKSEQLHALVSAFKLDRRKEANALPPAGTPERRSRSPRAARAR